jgi:hypothetical protein
MTKYEELMDIISYTETGGEDPKQKGKGKRHVHVVRK